MSLLSNNRKAKTSLSMNVTQISDWSSEPWQNSVCSKNTQPRDNAWEENENENSCKQTNQSKFFVLYGVLIGSLLAGIALAVVLIIWLRSPHSASTAIDNTTNSSMSSSSVPPNLLINPGAESGTLSPWIIGGSGTPSIDNGSANSGYNPYSGTEQFYGGSIGRASSNSGSSNTLTQSVYLLNGIQGYTAAQLDSGYLSVNISFYEQSYQFFGTNEGQISLTFRSSNNTLISTNMSPAFSCSSWCAHSYIYPLPMGTRRIDYTMIFILQTGYTIDSYFDDNSLQVY